MTSEHDVLFPWLRSVRAQLVSLSTSPIIVAYSGGVDSTCLLHLACQVIGPGAVTALHVNHGLSSNAEDWQQHCQQICLQWGCSFEAHRVDVTVAGQGLEAAARKARYAVFEQALSEGGVLLQGHHADDQVETVLLNMLRGSGTAGLQGIPASRAVGGGQLWRPLLELTRAQLQAYAEYFRLPMILDESNADLSFDRNYLRSRVIPPLLGRFNHLHGATRAMAQAMSDAEQLQLELAVQDANLDALVLPLVDIEGLSALRCSNVLRFWFLHHTGQPLPRQALTQLQQQVLPAKSDATPEVVVGQWMIRRSRGLLSLSRHHDVPFGWSASWDFSAPLVTPHGVLNAEPVMGGWQLPSPVEVRFRRGGERLRPSGTGG